MKKIVSVLLAVVAMCLIVASPAFAAGGDDGFVDGANGVFYGQSEFEFHEYSSFYVMVPTNIPADGCGFVSVTMNDIEDGYHINMYVTNMDENGMIDVSTLNGTTGKVAVQYNNQMNNLDSTGHIGSFYPADYSSGEYATTNVTLVKSDMYDLGAGLYHGVVCFKVECVED